MSTNLNYTDINEDVFINTMNKLKFKTYKRGNYKKIYCEYKDIKFEITYREKKVIIDMMNKSDSSLASYLVDQGVLKYDDMYTKDGYFRKNPTIYNIIPNCIYNAENSLDIHSALFNRFIDYIFIEYEKNLNQYEPSDTVIICLDDNLIKKISSNDKEREKFFNYIKITDEGKNLFIYELDSGRKHNSSSNIDYAAFLFIPRYSYSTFVIKSNFYNNGKDIKNKNKPKNNSSEKQSNTEIKEEIKTEVNSENIIKEKIINYIPKCKDKLKEIKELSNDFEYIIKNDYHKECDEIENRLNNPCDNIDEFNKIIDDINTLYRNAYNRKNNKSSLYYVMDIEDEDIDLIEHI